MAYFRLIRANLHSYASVSKKARNAIQESVRIHANRITRDIRASMRQPKHGNVYYYRGRAIVASAPGESPAIRSGKLYKNVTPIFQNNGLQAKIDPKAKGVHYAAWLEEGTTRMAPRPYLKPAFDRRRQAFLNEVRTKLAKALSKV